MFPDLQRGDWRRLHHEALIVVIMGGVGNMLARWSPVCCSECLRPVARSLILVSPSR